MAQNGHIPLKEGEIPPTASFTASSGSLESANSEISSAVNCAQAGSHQSPPAPRYPLDESALIPSTASSPKSESDQGPLAPRYTPGESALVPSTESYIETENLDVPPATAPAASSEVSSVGVSISSMPSVLRGESQSLPPLPGAKITQSANGPAKDLTSKFLSSGSEVTEIPHTAIVDADGSTEMPQQGSAKPPRTQPPKLSPQHITPIWSHKSLLDSFTYNNDILEEGFSTLVLPAENVSLDIVTTSLKQIPLSKTDKTAPMSVADDASSTSGKEKKVLAIRQTRHDVKVDIRLCEEPGRSIPCFSVYYDPVFDSQIIFPCSKNDFMVRLLSPETMNDDFMSHMQPLDSNGIMMKPGIWRIFRNMVHIADFWVLEKSPSVKPYCPPGQKDEQEEKQQHYELEEEEEEAEAAQQPSISPTKHSLSSESDVGERSKKQRTNDGEVMVGNLISDLVTGTTQIQEQGKQKNLLAYGQNPLYDLDSNTSISVDPEFDDGYTLERHGKLVHDSVNSRVYSGEYSGKAVMVKVLNCSNQKPDHEYNKRIRIMADSYIRECNIQRRLKHSSIVSLIGGDARYFALFMTPAQAYDLRDSLKWRFSDSHRFRGRVQDAVNILQQGSSALEYLHSQGIAHNDIKPGNLLYSRRYGLKLCDFGVSGSDTDISLHLSGTPWYIPPEYVEFGLRGYPGDMWAFGVTMLYVIGKTPLPESLQEQFPTWRIQDVHSDINSAPRALMKSWNDHIWDIASGLGPLSIHHAIKKMLKKKPAERATAKYVLALCPPRSIYSKAESG